MKTLLMAMSLFCSVGFAQVCQIKVEASSVFTLQMGKDGEYETLVRTPVKEASHGASALKELLEVAAQMKELGVCTDITVRKHHVLSSALDR